MKIWGLKANKTILIRYFSKTGRIQIMMEMLVHFQEVIYSQVTKANMMRVKLLKTNKTCKSLDNSKVTIRTFQDRINKWNGDKELNQSLQEIQMETAMATCSNSRIQSSRRRMMHQQRTCRMLTQSLVRKRRRRPTWIWSTWGIRVHLCRCRCRSISNNLCMNNRRRNSCWPNSTTRTCRMHEEDKDRKLRCIKWQMTPTATSMCPPSTRISHRASCCSSRTNLMEGISTWVTWVTTSTMEEASRQALTIQKEACMLQAPCRETSYSLLIGWILMLAQSSTKRRHQEDRRLRPSVFETTPVSSRTSKRCRRSCQSRIRMRPR